MKQSLIKNSIKALSLLILLNIAQTISNTKYDKWQQPNYFRGYNILYESPKVYQDFVDFKNYGGNVFHIQPDGFLSCDAPYDIVQANIDGCDMLVNYCRQAGIHYVIGMRSGPGAYDTFDESQGTTGESRVWNDGNTTEQSKYAEMLRMVVSRYAGDTLFVGINLVIEPRPKVRSIPTNVSATYKLFLENVYHIHMDRVYNSWVSSIRELDQELPIVIESFAYSTPELFPGYVINDPYIIYSAHNYQPVEYSKEEVPFSVSYPGVYWNISTLSQVQFDGAFMRNTVFSKLRDFQLTTGAPVFIGEMGMYKPQNGGQQFLADQLQICKDYGWHFAFWDWRRGPGADWNIEKFGDPDNLHWKTVLSYFNAPPVPVLVSPANNEVVDMSPSFSWESMTAFTTYDIEFRKVYGTESDVFIISDVSAASYSFGEDLFEDGQMYSWRVRAKNPGGLPENNSAWSEARYFVSCVNCLTNAPSQNEMKVTRLEQNYPNPFNPATSIGYYIAKNSRVNLTVYDMLGREVSNLVNTLQPQGNYSAVFDASNLSSGIYIYRLSVNPSDGSSGITEIKKMILVK